MCECWGVAHGTELCGSHRGTVRGPSVRGSVWSWCDRGTRQLKRGWVCCLLPAACRLLFVLPPGSRPEHVLVSPAGPDVSFMYEDFNGDGKFEVVAGQSFGKQDLVVYECPEKTWSACNTSNIQATVIDGPCEPPHPHHTHTHTPLRARAHTHTHTHTHTCARTHTPRIWAGCRLDHGCVHVLPHACGTFDS